MANLFDALVIGGGPGGATAAFLLAKAGWSVAVAEKSSFPRRKVCGEFLSATNFCILDELGLAEDFTRLAGPAVRQVGLFAGDAILVSQMPRLHGQLDSWGRALGREHLDTLMLARAAEAGAHVWQPWSVISLVKQEKAFVCRLASKSMPQERELQARIVIAAHGSWESGSLPTQCARRPMRSSDLFGFKAHFRSGHLPAELMPLIVFPGGYGGMVHSDTGRISFSCCIRRDALARIRRTKPQPTAAEAVLSHIRNSCLGVEQALTGAQREGEWLSVGPIRPGIRQKAREGIFLVGNAAGEAHPIVAEGISMAIQAAWLLSKRLIARQKDVLSAHALEEVSRDYLRVWRRNFATRIRAASICAHVSMHPKLTAVLLPFLRRIPATLTVGAQWSGKARAVIARNLQTIS